VPVVPHPAARFDDYEIEPQRQSWDARAVRQRAAVEQAIGSGADPDALSVVDGLLGQAELATRPPADLHDHQRGRRARVDRHEIELVTTDMDVPGQDGPTGVRESSGDQRFGGITRLLGRRPRRVVGSVRHAGIVAGDA
jgi:hypothetical protein